MLESHCQIKFVTVIQESVLFQKGFLKINFLSFIFMRDSKLNLLTINVNIYKLLPLKVVQSDLQT